MTRVEIVEGNPNPKAVTYKVDRDLMGPFSKIVFPKGGPLINYSPFVYGMYQRGGAVARIDLVAAENATLITLARMIPWDDTNRNKGREIVEEFFTTGHPFLYEEALTRDFTAHKPFKPQGAIGNFVTDTFVKAVNPELAKDGGAIELIGIEVQPTGEIYADVVMIGSCNGCSAATTSTLKNAGTKIGEVLDVLKKRTDNPDAQKLTFKEIRINEIPNLIFSRSP